MTFEIYSQPEGLVGIQWRWRFIAANGKKVASGEGYHNKDDCLHAIGLLMDCDRKTPVYQK